MGYASSGDGIVTLEKLKTLINYYGSEYNDLEFKQDWDLSTERHKAAAAKAMLAMSSCEDGGYIIIGVDNKGKIVGIPEGRDSSHYDTANLGNMVRPYGSLELNANEHWIGDKRVVIVYVQRADHGLTVIKKDSKENNFKAGDIFVRNNTSSEKISQETLNRIIKREVEREIKSRMLSLSLPYDPSKDIASTKRSLKSIINYEIESLEYTQAEETIIENLVRAAHEDDNDLSDLISVIKQWYIENFGYSNLDWVRSKKAFNLAVILEAIGAYSIRIGNLGSAYSIANVPVPVTDSYIYSSWIRHAQVLFARSNGVNTNDDKYLSLIDNGFGYVTKHRNLREDIDSDSISESDRLYLEDSLITYDFIWNVVAETVTPGMGYPSFMFYEASRIDQAITLVIENPKSFGFEDSSIAKEKISDVLYRAEKLSQSGDSFWLFNTSSLFSKFKLPVVKSVN